MSAYQDFWAGVGERFPDLGGAASTRYYADNEQRLFTEYLAPLAGLRVLKTDLWDEAKNTRILAWAAHRGARAFGIDIAEPTVIQAKAAFADGTGPLRAATADVRALPFRDGSFDAIYSMGTIEHFDETEQAVREMARVLRPGGRAWIYDFRWALDRAERAARPLAGSSVVRESPLARTSLLNPIGRLVLRPA